MDLNLLRLFADVADAESFSAAARKRGAQRSSVSRGIGTLERQVGVQLFNRNTRHVSLTSAGTALYAKVGPQLAAISDALRDVPERAEEPSGKLRITSPHDFGTMVLPRIVAGFVRRYPRVQVDAHISNRVFDLIAEGYDAAIRPGPGKLPDSTLVVRRISEVRGNVYASPSYLARAGRPKTMADASDHEWVLGPGATQLGLARPKRDPVVSSSDMLFVRQCARDGLGLAMLPGFVAREDLIDGTLVRVFPDKELIAFPYLLLHPPVDPYPRKLAVFRDYLLEYVEKHPLG